MSLVAIIPVEVKKIQDGVNAKRSQLIKEVRLAFEIGEIIDMNNCPKAAHIKTQVLTYSKSQFKIANVKRSNIAYRSAPTKILESIQNRKPLKLGSSCGINAAGTELTIFVFKEDYDGIKAGTVFLDARVSEFQDIAAQIPCRPDIAVIPEEEICEERNELRNILAACTKISDELNQLTLSLNNISAKL